MLRTALALAALGSTTLALPVAGFGQEARGTIEVPSVGSQAESYLRLLESLGEPAGAPASLRSGTDWFVAARDAGVAGRGWPVGAEAGPGSAGRIRLLPLETRHVHNSAFPYGWNDGALWAGAGLTSAVGAGFAASAGPLSLVLAPVLFRAENASFELAPNGAEGDQRFGHRRRFRTIDLPQRLGEAAYTRLDPGQSALRLDGAGLTLGVSTAHQAFGPAVHHPLILGHNAPGFPHLFAGTSRPLDLRVASVHARGFWGRLEETPYASTAADPTWRLLTGYAAVVQPRLVPGLELGLSRVFHSLQPPGFPSFEELMRGFQPFLKERLSSGEGFDDASAPDNQLASVFARWVFAPAGLEVYGEYAREDHNWNFRDLVLQPDQHMGYVLGLQKAWALPAERLVALSLETVNTRITRIRELRPQAPFYVHTGVRQGHTHRGQALGSAFALGGGGSVVGLDFHHAGGRIGARWDRMLNDPGEWSLRTDPQDVQHALGMDGRVLRGRFEIDAGVRGVFHLNRNLRGDAFNLNTFVGGRVRLGS